MWPTSNDFTKCLIVNNMWLDHDHMKSPFDLSNSSIQITQIYQDPKSHSQSDSKILFKKKKFSEPCFSLIKWNLGFWVAPQVFSVQPFGNIQRDSISGTEGQVTLQSDFVWRTFSISFFLHLFVARETHFAKGIFRNHFLTKLQPFLTKRLVSQTLFNTVVYEAVPMHMIMHNL